MQSIENDDKYIDFVSYAGIIRIRSEGIISAVQKIRTAPLAI